MDGFIIVDKPLKWTSHDIVAKARGILKTKKIGHLGTLDPLATGVLVLAVGKATKLIEYLMGCDKDYIAEIFLGTTSTTYDAEGEKIEITTEAISEKKIVEILKKFEGEIMQTPPAFSAIKIGGKKAYQLARKGKEVKLRPRKIFIQNISLQKNIPPVITVHISCSGGTYVRSLANDIGAQLGCGAYLSGLRRTRVGNFLLKDATTMETLSETKIIPLESGIPVNMQKINITETETEMMRNGRCIDTNAEIEVNEVACIFNKKCVGIGTYDKNFKKIRPKKII